MAKKNETSKAKSRTEPLAADKSNESPSDPTASTTAPPANTQSSDGKSSETQRPRWAGGSWKGKTAAVAEIARESISAAGAAANLTSSSKPQQIPQASAAAASTASPSSATLSKSYSSRLNTPSKSTPTTKLFLNPQDEPNSTSEKPRQESYSSEPKPSDNLDGNKEPKSSELTAADPEKSAQASGWLNWWGGTKKEQNETKSAPDQNRSDQAAADNSSQSNLEDPHAKRDSMKPSTKPASLASEPAALASQTAPNPLQNKPASTDGTTRKSAERSRASWFGLWGSGAGEADSTASPSVPKSTPLEPVASNVASDGFTALVDENAPNLKETKPSDPANQPSSSWAFWSRDTPNATSAAQPSENSKSEAGELAIANTKSESDPKPVSVPEEQPKKEVAASSKPDSRKRDRPESLQSKDGIVDGKKQKSDESKVSDKKPGSTVASGDESSQVSVEPPTREGEQSLRKKLQRINHNQLLPPLYETYHKTESPSYFQQLFRLLGRSGNEGKKYLSLSQSQPKIRKALAIGVHGYFPGPLVQKVLGQPTGTSIRFASGAAAAIQKWADDNNCPCEIEKVALEGEGMIDARVDTLWKLLLNWIDKIRQADLILVACHSQGVPVAAILVARLFNFGCLSANARVGMCAMAGINLGPFPSYQSRIIGTGTTHELFDFSRSQSIVSKAYASALTTCLQNHVRIVYIGSIDDQLVSLESALFATASHPYIYRAVFIDSRIHAPGFLTSLVGLACKLRNLGVSDHGLIRELSNPLAGSYTGGGHSRIYEDQSAYELAVQHTLETTTLTVNVPFEIKEYEVPSTANANPYFLPWAMRGVLEEDFVRTELKADTEDLLRRFETWKPSSKVLKDVKFRLEAVRSKL